jgi:hypothetical protein
LATEDASLGPAILSMGKVSEGLVNRLGDEPETEAGVIPLDRALRYLNPGLLNLVHIGVGFAVANQFIGLRYALVWLGITGVRNMVADIFSVRGARLSEWNLRSINFNNVARSLFWTGFSVPILGFVKNQFDLLWPFSPDGLLFNFAKFFFIAFANGLYLASHNKLRGFDRKVVRANLFRTIISWPFASVFAPLGNLLGVPSIVQSKFWSDVVAGFVEGGSKYLKTLSLRRRDLEEIIPRIVRGDGDDKHTAILDLLYLFREEPRTRNSLRDILGLAVFQPGARKNGGGQSAAAYKDLMAAIQDDRMYRELVDFILMQYTNEIAVDLVTLVTGTFPGFRDWLTVQGRPFGVQSLFKPIPEASEKAPEAQAAEADTAVRQQ